MRHLLAVALAAASLLAVLFVVAPTAAEEDPGSGDPRVGTVVSVQGRGLVRPGDRRRWTPLSRDAVLLPGDSVKTSARGPHALEIQLVGDTSLLLGPDTLVSLPNRGEVHVLHGDVEVRATKESAIALSGPGGFAQNVIGTALLRVDGTKATLLEEDPRWLKGYRESTGNEWMGSLLAQVDGRNVPLAVGYHKVTADIRDQIARTTVEQSFVNSTDQRLEGVFYFPLPADASISGFAMWIGNELVEADVVEKARARQIYEDILRRKKDPGLLEWQGGNLFKARVFPIEPHSEKRVRLRYTQVLRLEGDTYRYRYALRSDLLRSKPLRRLDVQVNVASEQPLTKVVCPSHACEIDQSEARTEARVRFDAEDYVPTRDLEVAVSVEVDTGLSTVSYRSGDEGTFMLLLSPPAGEGVGWTRELLPDGEPLDLILVADTSGSMDAAARESQGLFVEGLLDLLGPDDRFRLVATDVAVHEAFDAPQAATDETRAAARAFLDGRVSLGWTDLDHTLETALAEAGPGTTVIYVGDGVPTTGDADPVAQAERLRGLAAQTKATVHAVAPSATYEQGVLDALASIGGGSVRRADAAPAAAAHALLNEISRPVLRNAKVKITGIPTARVYPETLPNLPLGGQQVVLGRFLPGAEDTEGQVAVVGELDGEHVIFVTTMRLPATDAGNSFLPRLWARRHVDALLAQGPSQAVKDEIVSFSAEYGILTPHTSLLVLESDEDRERYGVARTVKMRDGEAFFAEGRDKVALEMAREQARKARAWRQALRRRMQKEIRGLGRDLVPDLSLASSVAFGEALQGIANSEYGSARGWGAEGKKGGYDRGEVRRGGPIEQARNPSAVREPVIKDEEIADHVETDNDLPFEESLGEDGLSDAPFAGPARTPSTPPPPGRPRASRGLRDADEFVAESRRFRGRGGRRKLKETASKTTGGVVYDADERLERTYMARVENQFDLLPPGALTPQSVGFPWLADPLEPRRVFPAPDWSDDVVALLKSLDRREALLALAGGLRVARQTARVHPIRNDDVLASSSELVLVSATRWFAGSEASGVAQILRWLDADHRVHVDVTRGLGRRRAAVERDREDASLLLDTFDYDEFVDTFRRRRVVLVDSKSRLRHVCIQSDDLSGADRHLRIDPERRVIVEEWTERRGRVIRRTRYGGFVEVSGLWWPRLTRVFDTRDRMIRFVTTEVSALDAEAFDGALATATAPGGDALYLDGKLPKLDDAKQAVHESRGAFADHLTLALHAAGRQGWDDVLAQWRLAKPSIATKRGAAWLELAFLSRARRGEEFLAAVRSMANGATDEAEVLYNDYAAGMLGPNEKLDVLRRLEAAWKASDARAALRFGLARATAFAQSNRHREAREVRARLAATHPYDLGLLRYHVTDLMTIGDVETAIGLLAERATSQEPQRFTRTERASLYQRLTDLLWSVRRLDDLETQLHAWTETAPTQEAWRRAISFRFLRGQVAAADQWVIDTLRQPVPVDELSDAYATCRAAMRLALGDAWLFNTRRVEPAFVPVLVDLGRRIARESVPPVDLLQSITGDWRFRQTDGARRLQNVLREDALSGSIDSLRRLVVYGAQVSWARSSVAPDVFEAFIGPLGTRWQEMPAGRERDALADLLVRLYDTHGDRDEALTVLRNRLEGETGHRRTPIAAELFDRLLGIDEPLLASREEEAFAQLPDLLDPYDPDRHDAVAATAARRLARWSYAARRKALLGDPAKRPEQTRAEARAAARKATADARRGLVARLRRARTESPQIFLRWLAIEQLGYAVELGEGLPGILASATELLDTVPKTSDKPLDAALAERCVLVLDFLTLRSNAPEGAADLVLQLFITRDLDAADERLDWKYETFRLMLALDRTPELEARLGDWIQPSRVRSLWRIALGYVLAEQGRLDEAARLLEQVAASDELSAQSYGVLATWYLVLGDDAARERALEGQDRMRSENELSNLVRRARSGGRGGVPDDFDPETLRHIRWLLRKASHPQNHIWRLKSLYQNVRDHRLLESLAEGLPGHTPDGLYGFLRQAGELTKTVYEEATVDAAIERIESLIEAAEKPHDRRGLLLLRVLLDTRAALAAKADPEHARRAIAALAQIPAGEWLLGERVQVAEVVAATAPVKHTELAAARLALLNKLLAAEPADSPWRLGVADARARVLWAHGKHGEAIDALTAAMDATRDDAGQLPNEAWTAFDRIVNWTAEVGHFRDAEQLLVDELGRAEFVSRRNTVQGRLLQLYAQAAGKDGTLSFGRGTALVTQATQRMDEWIAKGPPGHARQTAWHVVNLHEGAKKHIVSAKVTTHFERWARERLPLHFERLLLESTALAQVAGDGLRRIAGSREALDYALDHMDQEPAFFQRIGYDYWSSDHYDLARWRRDAAPIGELGKQLLPRVLASLGEWLRGGRRTGQSFWQPRGNRYWALHADEYAATASAQVELHAKDVALQKRSASYLRDLKQRAQAVAVLKAALARGDLDEDGARTLAIWMVQDQRFAEALEVLAQLLETRADDLEIHVHQALALHGVERTDDGVVALRTAETRWRERKRWKDGVAARLGEVALRIRRAAPAETWLEEAVKLRTEARGGGADSTLGRYYGLLAQARVALGKTDAAVDAASAGVVAWGRNNRQRTAALRALEKVLEKAEDLDAYVERYEAQVAETGLDAPVLRKAFAAVFTKLGRHPEAVPHLRAAREVAPEDAEIHQRLVAAYDALGQEAEAVNALLASLAQAPRNLEAAADLARRYEKTGKTAAAERARTNLVEPLPHESAGHVRLATLRAQAKDHEAALVQWRQVVRTDPLDPTGWLAEARCEVTLARHADARRTLEHVLATKWQSRFGDVHKEAAGLLKELP